MADAVGEAGPKREGGDGEGVAVPTFAKWLEGVLPGAYAVGLLPHEVGALTPDELLDVVDNRLKQQRAQAWLIAVLLRTERLPEPDEWLDPPPAPTKKDRDAVFRRATRAKARNLPPPSHRVGGLSQPRTAPA